MTDSPQEISDIETKNESSISQKRDFLRYQNNDNSDNSYNEGTATSTKKRKIDENFEVLSEEKNTEDNLQTEIHNQLEEVKKKAGEPLNYVIGFALKIKNNYFELLKKHREQDPDKIKEETVEFIKGNVEKLSNMLGKTMTKEDLDYLSGILTSEQSLQKSDKSATNKEEKLKDIEKCLEWIEKRKLVIECIKIVEDYCMNLENRNNRIENAKIFTEEDTCIEEMSQLAPKFTQSAIELYLRKGLSAEDALKEISLEVGMNSLEDPNWDYDGNFDDETKDQKIQKFEDFHKFQQLFIINDLGQELRKSNIAPDLQRKLRTQFFPFLMNMVSEPSPEFQQFQNNLQASSEFINLLQVAQQELSDLQNKNEDIAKLLTLATIQEYPQEMETYFRECKGYSDFCDYFKNKFHQDFRDCRQIYDLQQDPRNTEQLNEIGVEFESFRLLCQELTKLSKEYYDFDIKKELLKIDEKVNLPQIVQLRNLCWKLTYLGNELHPHETPEIEKLQLFVEEKFSEHFSGQARQNINDNIEKQAQKLYDDYRRSEPTEIERSQLTILAGLQKMISKAHNDNNQYDLNNKHKLFEEFKMDYQYWKEKAADIQAITELESSRTYLLENIFNSLIDSCKDEKNKEKLEKWYNTLGDKETEFREISLLREQITDSFALADYMYQGYKALLDALEERPQ